MSDLSVTELIWLTEPTSYNDLDARSAIVTHDVPRLVREIIRRRMTDGLLCTRPPIGWWCSRPLDHQGPCAARPL